MARPLALQHLRHRQRQSVSEAALVERPLIPALQPRGLAGLRPGAACLAVLAHPVCHRILRPETRSEELAMYVQHPPPRRNPKSASRESTGLPRSGRQREPYALHTPLAHWGTDDVIVYLFVCSDGLRLCSLRVNILCRCWRHTPLVPALEAAGCADWSQDEQP